MASRQPLRLVELNAAIRLTRCGDGDEGYGTRLSIVFAVLAGQFAFDRITRRLSVDVAAYRVLVGAAVGAAALVGLGGRRER